MLKENKVGSCYDKQKMSLKHLDLDLAHWYACVVVCFFYGVLFACSLLLFWSPGRLMVFFKALPQCLSGR